MNESTKHPAKEFIKDMHNHLLWGLIHTIRIQVTRLMEIP